MRKQNVLHFALFAAAILALSAGCNPISPGPSLSVPQVLSAEATSDYASVQLTALLDHAGNVKQGGFYLWRDSGEKLRQVGILAGNTLTVRCEGLEPETDYQYAVFYGNGRTEAVSDTHRFTTAQLPMPQLAEAWAEPSHDSAAIHVRLTGTEFLQGDCLLSYWPDGEQTRQQQILVPDGEDGSFACTLQDLQPETDYLYLVILSNGKRTEETPPMLFRTAPAPEPEPEPEPEREPVIIPGERFDPEIHAYLLRNFDTDADGQMSDIELESIQEVILSDLLLESQDGLELLVNLVSLSMGDNQLTRLDLSANKHLRFISLGRDPYLEELVLDNPELTQTYIIEAVNLRTLDLSRCPALNICEWWNVGLDDVDFSSNQELRILRFSGTHLKELDLSANKRLRQLQSSENPSLSVIWLWERIKLESCEVESHTQIKYKQPE